VPVVTLFWKPNTGATSGASPSGVELDQSPRRS
jgi:hypothetical protein